MVNEKAIFYSSEQSRLFAQTDIQFFITSKHGGFSTAPYETLNLAYHTRDQDSSVLLNREMVCKTFFPNKMLLWMDQIHSDKILEVSKQPYKSGFVGKGDAMVCTEKSFACMAMVADCNPVLVYEPKIHTFGVIHAGREGVKKRIVSKTIAHILQNPKAKVENMLIFIGPSIRKCCYEIGNELAISFPKKYLIQKDVTYNLDLIKMLQDELLSCQIKPSQTEILPTCTCCEKNLFSYRREGITGRFGLIAALR